jgi:hypothetical protein
MDPQNLEREMDAVLARLTESKDSARNVYGADPLASDHLLLRRSWDFFKKRVAAIEDQWRDISNTKQEEIHLLKKQLKEVQERLYEVEQDRLSASDFLRALEMARLEDHEKFRTDKDKLTQRWEEERVSLESDRIRLEQANQLQAAKLERQESLTRAVENEMKAVRSQFRDAEAKWQETQLALIEKMNQQIVEKDELFQSEQLKTDLLRREVERLNQTLKESSLREESLLEKGRVLETKLGNIVEELARLQDSLVREKDVVASLLAERDRLRSDWDREKSEWRELWDRSRALQDKRTS